MRIEGSVALVTGANRGIGRALVEALLAAGARKVYATARSLESLEPVAALDARVAPLRLDVTSAGDLDGAVAAAGDVTLLVNNAGVLSSFDPFDGPLDAVRHDMEVNGYGLLAAIRAFAPVIEGNGGGAMANVLSVAGLANMPVIGGYSVSKAAAHSITQNARVSLARRGISVHGVYPGPVDTDMTKGFELDKASPKSVAERILRGIEAGNEDIFPDTMADQVGATWAKDPKEVERMFAAF